MDAVRFVVIQSKDHHGVFFKGLESSLCPIPTSSKGLGIDGQYIRAYNYVVGLLSSA